MSITVGTNNSVQTNTETAVALKTVNLAKNQQSREGQMALELIQSANISSVPAVSGNVGSQINIKV